MRVAIRAGVGALLWGIFCAAHAGTEAPACFAPEVQTHVRRTMAIYGPMSVENEFFGFIFRYSGRIDSAVVRGHSCAVGNCVVDVNLAAQRIPRGARVLGEWHTHPRRGSRALSMLDVSGAYRNHALTCYAAYFSRPDGEILAWNPNERSVPAAMASLVQVGNFTVRSG